MSNLQTSDLTISVQRSQTHITDTLAVRKVMGVLSENWIFRDMTERDYGIDLMVEYFDGKNPTGLIAFFQIKGTEGPIQISDDKIAFSLHRKTLAYTECFSVPFFLIHCDTRKDNRNVYFVWLQKYIETRFISDYPDWKTRSQESFTIYIPASNKLPDDESRLVTFCQQPQFQKETLHLLGYLFHWKHQYGAILCKQLGAIEPCIHILKQMAALKLALNGQDVFLDAEHLVAGVKALNEIKLNGFARGQKSLAVLEEVNDQLNIYEVGATWKDFDLFKLEATGDIPY